MRTLRALGRLALTVLHALHGVAIVLWSFPRKPEPDRHARIQWWAAKMLRVMGVQRVVEGVPHAGATLIAANHVSWLDIVALHSVCPHARFVSKADIKHWPVIHHLVSAAGTLYIERERKRDALRVVHQMAEALQQGQTVAVFPEGTTGDGRALLPFHANLLQAAIAVEAPVQPVALRFSDPSNHASPAAAYVGETTLVQSVWRIACAEGLTVHVSLLPAIGSRHADRRALAERVREQIAAAL
jgi:1-acyl-sn-glycerol-3-phosphate acyltransferase